MAGSFLRQSTASQSRATPPFLDDTDFKTAETALTIANTDVKLVVNGGASADKNSGGGTHRANGVYGLTFDATDTATVGEMEVSIKVAGALPVFMKFWVLEEAVYDAIFAASALGYVANAPVSVAQWTGTNVASPDTAGYPKVTVKSGTGTGELSLSSGQVILQAGTGTGQLDFTSGVVKANVTQFGGTNATSSGGRPEVNTTHIAGTAWASTTLFTLASHDPGATIGTSTLTQTQVTGGAYSVQSASCVLGDARVANLDATVSSRSTLTQTQVTGGAYSMASSSQVLGDTRIANLDATISSRVAATIFTGITSLAQWLGLIAGKQTGNTTARTEIRATGAGSGTYDETTDSQEAIRDRGDAAWTTATGFATSAALATAQADLDTLTGADGVTLATSQPNYAPATASALASLVTTVGVAGDGLTEAGGTGDHLTAIDLPDQTMNITGNITGNLSGSVGSVTGNVGGVAGTITTLDAIGALLTSAVPDSIPADGSRPSVQQALYMIVQLLTESGISGTTWTVKKPDGSTTLFTMTLDDGTTPTSKTRAT